MRSDFLVDFPGLGINDLPVNREAFSVFGQSIYWYGLLIATAIILCLLLSAKSANKFGLVSDDILDIFIFLIPMIIVFARVFYVIFEWEYYAADLSRIFNTRNGGLAFYGGVIGGIITIMLVAKFKKLKISKLIDHLVVYLPLGQAIGRWGNFFNQEAFGTNTTMPWGMYSNETARYLTSLGAGYDPTMPVHPTFLYEFIGNMVIFAILLILRRKRRAPFVLAFSYFGMYGLLRFFVEAIRTDALFIPGTDLRISMVLSALMVISAIIYIPAAGRRYEKLALNSELIDSDEQVNSVSEELLDAKASEETTSAETAEQTDTSDEMETVSDANDFIEIEDDQNQEKNN